MAKSSNSQSFTHSMTPKHLLLSAVPGWWRHNLRFQDFLKSCLLPMAPPIICAPSGNLLGINQHCRDGDRAVSRRKSSWSTHYNTGRQEKDIRVGSLKRSYKENGVRVKGYRDRELLEGDATPAHAEDTPGEEAVHFHSHLISLTITKDDKTFLQASWGSSPHAFWNQWFAWKLPIRSAWKFPILLPRGDTKKLPGFNSHGALPKQGRQILIDVKITTLRKVLILLLFRIFFTRLYNNTMAFTKSSEE